MSPLIYAGAPTHVYRIGGRRGVGVSQVLVESGLRPAPDGPQAKIREKAFVGRLVHELIVGWHVEPSPKFTFDERVAALAEARGSEYPPTTVERAGKYWNSFVRLPGMIRIMARLWEQVVVVCDRPLVCGTLDFWGDVGRRRVLLDWKCRPISDADDFQTAAYLVGLRRLGCYDGATARACVELRPDGDPRIRWQTDDEVALARWRQGLEKWIDARATAQYRRGKLEKEQQDGEQGFPWDDAPGAGAGRAGDAGEATEPDDSV